MYSVPCSTPFYIVVRAIVHSQVTSELLINSMFRAFFVVQCASLEKNNREKWDESGRLRIKKKSHNTNERENGNCLKKGTDKSESLLGLERK